MTVKIFYENQSISNWNSLKVFNGWEELEGKKLQNLDGFFILFWNYTLFCHVSSILQNSNQNLLFFTCSKNALSVAAAWAQFDLLIYKRFLNSVYQDNYSYYFETNFITHPRILDNFHKPLTWQLRDFTPSIISRQK